MQEIFDFYKASIEKALAEIFAIYPHSQLKEAVNYSCLNGGKRLRAILALISAEAVQNKNFDFENNPAKNLALALELIHAGSLIHDDLPCMDNDDFRRGKASNHKVFGEAMALLAGDLLLIYPLSLVNFNQELSIKLQNAIVKMIVGQAMDMEFGLMTNPSLENLTLMQQHKTGALIEVSISGAALLAGAKQGQINALSNFANKIGLAFQIVDDILDHTADFAELGKTTGKDQEQNKLTFVKYYGLKEAKTIAQELIQKAKQDILDIGINTDRLLIVADYVLDRKN